MGIVVFGACFVDIKGYPLATYIPGGRNVGRVIQEDGGVSRNVAEDIANVELRPVYVSVADYSGTSTDLIDRLNRHKVDTHYMRRTEDGLGTWLAIFDNTGDVTASISKRPDLRVITDILREQGDEIISNADSVVVEIDMDPKQLKMIFDLADKYGKQVYAVVSNMSIALERRDLLMRTGCVVCNEQEAGMLFSEDYEYATIDEIRESIARRIISAQFPKMVVTLGDRGAVFAQISGDSGYCPPQDVDVIDSTGAGDAFFAGVAIGLTYGKNLEESCSIGTRLASSVIMTKESVCPRFLPSEFGLSVPEGAEK